MKSSLQMLLALSLLGLPMGAQADESGAVAKAADGAVTMAPEALSAMLTRMDARQQAVGDYRAVAFIEQREKDKNDLVYEAVIYRRDEQERFMILFTAPRTEAGKGYLRIDRNLWLYDPTTGKWERRTERDRIGGTDSRRADFDPIELAKDFTAEYRGQAKLGRFKVHKVHLKAKPDASVPYPVLDLWIDVESEHTLKQQERALSGKLMRTVYYPEWGTATGPSSQGEVHFPKEIRIFDEVEKGNRTTVVFKQVALEPLKANMFTKAWLESRSR